MKISYNITDLTSAEWKKCMNPELETFSTCIGLASVFRMTFALFIFHLITLLLILPRNGCAAVIHDGGWCFKILLVIGMYIGFMWIPTSFFFYWAQISKYISIIFIFVQCLYVLTAAYDFNDYLMNSGTNDENWRNCFMLIYTLLLTGGSLALIVTGFIYFNGPTPVSTKTNDSNISKTNSTNPLPDLLPISSDPSCGSSIALMSITCALFILVCGLRFRPDSSLFTAAIVNLWLCFLMWSSLALKEDSCNTLYTNEGASWFNFIGHFVWTFITLFALGSATTGEGKNEKENAVKSGFAEDSEAKPMKVEDIDKEGGVEK